MWEVTEEWLEACRQQRLREDQMLAFHDEVGGRITGKALAEKFDLKQTRVNLLIRRRKDERERERMAREIKRLEERLTASPVSPFGAIAERLWMDLEWLATELERRGGVV